MTARPLMDLEAHANVVVDCVPLLLCCLGAGGRLGLLLVARAIRSQRPFAMPVGVPHDCHTPTLEQLSSWSTSLPTVLYSQREYYGRDQFYFRWKLMHDYF